jgi:IS5 family transposase
VGREGECEARAPCRYRDAGAIAASEEPASRSSTCSGKCEFGYRKVRYRGIAKNGAQVLALLALASLFLARRTLPSA